MKKLMMTTAATAMMVGTAFAQDATQTDPLLTPDSSVEAPATLAEETPMAPTGNETDTDAMDSATDVPVATPGSDMPQSDVAQSDEMNTGGSDMAMYGAFADTAVRDLVGKNVLTGDGEDVGEVDSLVKDGDAVHAVVGVGGFLGLGEHDVAIPLADFVDSEDGLMLPDATQESLEAMAEFDGTGTELPMDVTVAGAPAEQIETMPADPMTAPTGTDG